jgi:hypothetical protein
MHPKELSGNNQPRHLVAKQEKVGDKCDIGESHTQASTKAEAIMTISKCTLIQCLLRTTYVALKLTVPSMLLICTQRQDSIYKLPWKYETEEYLSAKNLFV